MLTEGRDGLVSGIFTEGTERSGEWNVDCKKRADRRPECYLKEQSGLGSGMLTDGTERTAERNAD